VLGTLSRNAGEGRGLAPLFRTGFGLFRRAVRYCKNAIFLIPDRSLTAKYQQNISGQNSEITVVQQRDQRRHASFLMGMVPRCHRAVHIAQFVILSRTK
jgi:hypothetical protein